MRPIPVKLVTSNIEPDYYDSATNAYNAMNVTWALTRRCSLACTYCNVCDRYAKHVVSLSDYEAIRDYIVSITLNKKYGEIMLFGGEPTLSPYWKMAVVDFHTRVPHIGLSMFTNLHASATEYQWAQSMGVGIETSYHYGVDASQYVDKILQLSPKGLQCYVMLDPRDIPACKKVFYALLDAGYYVELNRIYDKDLILSREDEIFMLKESTFNTKASKRYLVYTYSDGQTKELSFQQAAMLGMTSFTNWKCTAGAANVFVECTGDVYPCQVYANEGFAPLGNIIHGLNANNLPITTCKAPECSCEIFIPKWV